MSPLISSEAYQALSQLANYSAGSGFLDVSWATDLEAEKRAKNLTRFFGLC